MKYDNYTCMDVYHWYCMHCIYSDDDSMFSLTMVYRIKGLNSI